MRLFRLFFFEFLILYVLLFVMENNLSVSYVARKSSEALWLTLCDFFD